MDVTAWTQVEDDTIRKGVEQYGPTNWNKVASLLPHRSVRAIKARYYEYISGANSGDWNPVEDEKLRKYAKVYHNQWVSVASIVGKTAQACSERFEALINQEMELKDAPLISTISASKESRPAEANPTDLSDSMRETVATAEARMAQDNGRKAQRQERERREKQLNFEKAIERSRKTGAPLPAPLVANVNVMPAPAPSTRDEQPQITGGQSQATSDIIDLTDDVPDDSRVMEHPLPSSAVHKATPPVMKPRVLEQTVGANGSDTPFREKQPSSTMPLSSQESPLQPPAYFATAPVSTQDLPPPIAHGEDSVRSRTLLQEFAALHNSDGKFIMPKSRKPLDVLIAECVPSFKYDPLTFATRRPVQEKQQASTVHVTEPANDRVSLPESDPKPKHVEMPINASVVAPQAASQVDLKAIPVISPGSVDTSLFVDELVPATVVEAVTETAQEGTPAAVPDGAPETAPKAAPEVLVKSVAVTPRTFASSVDEPITATESAAESSSGAVPKATPATVGASTSSADRGQMKGTKDPKEGAQSQGRKSSASKENTRDKFKDTTGNAAQSSQSVNEGTHLIVSSFIHEQGLKAKQAQRKKSDVPKASSLSHDVYSSSQVSEEAHGSNTTAVATPTEAEQPKKQDSADDETVANDQDRTKLTLEEKNDHLRHANVGKAKRIERGHEESSAQPTTEKAAEQLRTEEKGPSPKKSADPQPPTSGVTDQPEKVATPQVPAPAREKSNVAKRPSSDAHETSTKETPREDHAQAVEDGPTALKRPHGEPKDKKKKKRKKARRSETASDRNREMEEDNVYSVFLDKFKFDD